jgi:hypothetical protein
LSLLSLLLEEELLFSQSLVCSLFVKDWSSSRVPPQKIITKEGIDGLKDRSKSGRPSEIPNEVAVRIRKELLESKQGWTTKQVSNMICTEGGVRYHYMSRKSTMQLIQEAWSCGECGRGQRQKQQRRQV